MRMVSLSALLLTIPTISCAHTDVVDIVEIQLSDLQTEPRNYLGETVRIEGYFRREWLVPKDLANCIYEFDRGQKGLYVILNSSDNLRVDDFNGHWVVVEGDVAPPRTLRNSGGDLMIEISDADMFAILDNARIVSFNKKQVCL